MIDKSRLIIFISHPSACRYCLVLWWCLRLTAAVCPPSRWVSLCWLSSRCGLTAAMLLPLLVRHSLCCPHVLLTRCVRTLRCDTARTLRSQTEHFLQRRLPLRSHTQSRGVKSRNRKSKSQEEDWKSKNKTVLTYIAAAGVGMIGLSYAAVPLYRLYCQVRRCFKGLVHPKM